MRHSEQIASQYFTQNNVTKIPTGQITSLSRSWTTVWPFSEMSHEGLCTAQETHHM